jgi:phenylalanine-4-hydroxylase
VTLGSLSLFEPEWGPYDMAVGARIVSVYAGAADQDAFEEPPQIPAARTGKRSAAAGPKALGALYARARAIHEGREAADEVPGLWRKVRREFQEDWLLQLELLEISIARRLPSSLREEIRSALEEQARARPELARVIGDGLVGMA